MLVTPKRLLIIFLIVPFLIKGFLYLKGSRSPQVFGVAIRRIPTTQKVVALTYDDGPHPVYTDQILEALNEFGVKATFFLIGEQLEKHPEYVKKISDQGHELGNHGWSHQQLIFRSPSFILNEITKTDNLIKDLGYTGEIHFRAPYGRKLFILPWVLSSQNRKHILFDVAPHDWARPGVDVIVQRVLSNVKNGSIILLHDGGGDRSQTVQASKKIIKQLLSEGYQFLTISDLLAI